MDRDWRKGALVQRRGHMRDCRCSLFLAPACPGPFSWPPHRWRRPAVRREAEEDWGRVTPMREFADQKALQNYVKLHDLVYLWEGTRPFAMRFAQLSPKQCEVVDVRTKRGATPS